MCRIKARGKLNGQEIKDIPVLNPGDWFGKTWLIEIGGSYWPLFLVVRGRQSSGRHRRTRRQQEIRTPDHSR